MGSWLELEHSKSSEEVTRHIQGQASNSRVLSFGLYIAWVAKFALQGSVPLTCKPTRMVTFSRSAESRCYQQRGQRFVGDTELRQGRHMAFRIS